MRIPGTKIYRAFEELDRFSDEQCENFLRAALRPGRRVMRWLVSTLVGGGLMVVLMTLVVWAMTLVPMRPRESDGVGFWFVSGGATLLVVGVCVFSAVLLRDFLLRRRLRIIISTRGVCRNCRYLLLGLPVSETNTVACPECGATSEVDPSLGELAIAGSGARTLRQANQLKQSSIFLEGFWNPGRLALLRRLGRWALRTAVVLLFVVTVGVLWRWFRAESEAQAANGMLQPGASISRRYASLQPLGSSPTSANAWLVIADFGREVGVIASTVYQQATLKAAAVSASATSPLLRVEYLDVLAMGRPDPSALQWPAAAGTVSYQAAFNATMAAEGQRLLSESAVIHGVDVLATMDRYDPPWNTASVTLGNNAAQYADAESLRKLIRFCTGRIALAAKAGDMPEVVRAFRTGMTASRLAACSLPIYASMAQCALLDAIWPALRTADAATLREIARELERADSRPNVVEAIETERLIAEKQVCEFFSHPENTRWGAFSLMQAHLLRFPRFDEWWASPPLGSFAENLAAVRQTADNAKAWGQQRPVDRFSVSGVLPVPPASALWYIQYLGSICDMTIGWYDRWRTMLEGTKMLVAIERFEREHGAFPRQLDQIVPEFAAAVAVDLWSGKEFRYRVVDSIASVADGGEGKGLAGPGWGFILYSVGTDGVDDGGKDAGEAALGLWGPQPPRAAPLRGDFVFTNPPAADRWGLGW